MKTGHANRGGAPWHQVGTEPDYRFSLANERTFLAWLRTSLALMAAAVAVSQLLPSLHLHASRRLLALLLACLGLLISATAYRRWVANERAMRTSAPLPRTPMLQIAGYGLSLVGIIVVIVVIVG
jgi:putative membrane protein